MNKFKSAVVILSSTFFPAIAFAQTPPLPRIDNVTSLITRISTIGNAVIYVLISLAVLFIIYKVVMYLIKGNAGDESRREAGMQIFWGIVGLFIILSLWGLVNILIKTFNTDNNAPKDRFPTANFVPGANTGIPGGN